VAISVYRGDGTVPHQETAIAGDRTQYRYRDGRLLPKVAGTPSQSAIERLCMANMLANPNERFFFKDAESRFLLVSAGWLEAVGRGGALEDVIGKTDFDMVARELASVAFDDEQRVIATGEPMPVRVERDWLPDRPNAWLSTSKLPLLDEDGTIVGTWGIARDVTAQVEAEQALVQQALHDASTGLANRVLLMDRLTQALISLERRGGHLALLFADLNGFKCVNDRLGHEAGDQVLCEVGRRLTKAARRVDTVARFGGDEFVVLCTGLASERDIRVVGERLMAAVAAPMTVGGAEIVITASFGAIVTADPHADPVELVRQADHALYDAKRDDRGALAVFDPQARRADGLLH
jgi:diguanylate cyclase (GGDEF)-like protein/PAS domain S-box-containing protein